MEDKIQQYRLQVIRFRKQLADLETRRAQCHHPVPGEIWQEFAEVSHRLEQAEQQIRQICLELAGDLNQIRTEIVSMLEQYTRCREQMRQVEDLFLLNIVRPGHHLKQAIRQREYLERAYQRIYTGIQYESYASQVELEADIRRVLMYGDTALDARATTSDDELLQENDLLPRLDETHVDDLVEAISKEALIKEFKRVVLPKVHPDTSATPAEVFKTVYEVYQKCDPLLMEAYIVKYRGEIGDEEDVDPLESLDQGLQIRQRYQRLCVRLQRRLDRLKQDLTTQEVENPGKIQETMQQQRKEILARIQFEVEQLRYWRDKIWGLVKIYRERDGSPGSGE